MNARRTLTADPNGRPTRDALERDRAGLLQKKARLLVDDPDGDALRLVKQQLTATDDRLQDEREREAALQDRAVEATAKARAQQEAEARARLTVFETVELPAAAHAVDAALAHTAHEIANLQALLDQAARLRDRLAITSRRRTDLIMLEGVVTWTLRAVFPVAARSPHLHRFRHPLAGLLTPAPAPPTPALVETATP